MSNPIKLHSWPSSSGMTSPSSHPPSSPPAPPATTTKKYFHLRPGHGGIFQLPMKWHNLDGTEDEISAIGTDSCFTCVCFWIPLNDDRLCFAVHMAAWRARTHEEVHTYGLNEFDWAPQDPNWIATLKEELDKHMEKVVPDIMGIPEHLRNRAIVTCPQPTEDGQTATGAHIISVVREVFNLPASCNKPGHGFVVDVNAPDTPQMLWWKNKDGGRVSFTPAEMDQEENEGEEVAQEFPKNCEYEACNARMWNLCNDREGKWVWLPGEYPYGE